MSRCDGRHREVLGPIGWPVGFVAIAVAIAGCGNEPTPAGTQVLSQELSAEIAAEARAALGDSTEHVEVVPVHDGEGQITVRLTTAATPAGGRYIQRVVAIVDDAAGYEVTASLIGNPTNAGSTEAPIHTRLLQVSAHEESALSKSSSIIVYHIRGDGTVSNE